MDATTSTEADDGPARAEVVVVGAGLSGLVAARALHRAGVDVMVLEAADRTGGRALAETSALGSRVDLGGQWLGHDHHRLAALADEVGATAFPMHTVRLPLVLDGRRRVRPLSPTTATAVAALAAAGAWARLGPRHRGDTTTLAALLRRVPGRTARRLLALVVEVSWTVDLDRLSLAGAAHLVRRQGGLATMLATRGGAQDALLVEGVGTVADRLAADLGDRVHTGAAVTAVTQGPDEVVVRTATGEVRAAAVVVAVPPPLVDRIAFTPPLPAATAATRQATAMGAVYKAVAVYDRPFWRDRGDAEALVVAPLRYAVFDSSPPDGPGHLCVLVGGSEARSLDGRTPAGRRQALLGPLADRLGDEVLRPVGWHERAWHLDDHVGGGYIALPVPGTTDGWLPVDAAPFGRLHWAGAETAHDHPGYLDGAIEAGDRAAAEVLAALGRAPGRP